MKMQLLKNLHIRNLSIVLPALATFVIFTSATRPVHIGSAALQVKFLGGDNDALFFNVKYDNKNGNNFRLIALDATGEACFQDDYSKKDFEKKIKIPRLTDTDYVIFLIRSSKENIELSYKVKVTTKVVDETVFLKNRELVSYK